MTSKPRGVADHPEKDFMQAMWESGDRATAILEWLEANGHPTVNESTLSRYGQRYWTDSLEEEWEDTEDYVSQAEQLVSRIQNSDLGEVKRISVSKTSYSLGIDPKKQVPLKKANDIKVTVKGGTRLKGQDKLDGWKTGIFLPDMQFGYWEGKNQEFHTTQDEAAISVAHQILADLEATYELDLVVNAGDNLDLPALSTHRSAPGFWHTTDLALNRAAMEGAIQRAQAPKAEIVWIAGNHEQRLTNFLIDKAPAFVGLTRAGDEHPVLSIPNLCRFDENDITYLDPYPDAEHWVNDHLRFEHGSYAVAAPGGSANKHLKNGVSVGYGHIHRSELLYQTRHTKNGPRTHFAGSPGCLCRIDGSVPSSRTGVNSGGSQAQQKTEDWQQGLWVFHYQETGEQLVAIEPIQIWGGWCMWRGKEYFATCDSDGVSYG